MTYIVNTHKKLIRVTSPMAYGSMEFIELIRLYPGYTILLDPTMLTDIN